MKLFIGVKVNKLTVIDRLENDRHGNPRFMVRCECGTEKKMLGTNLTGRVKSCGCVRRAVARTKPIGKYRTTDEQRGMAAVYRRYRTNAKARQLHLGLSVSDVTSICKQNCHYCGCPPQMKSVRRYHNSKTGFSSERSGCLYNGIDRRDPNTGYTLENSVPCCWRCNNAKGPMTESEFLAWLKCASMHQKERLRHIEAHYVPFLHPGHQRCP